MQIDGCSALVVGGAGGLGEATVRRLHAAGAKVVVADLADEKGKALEQELGVRYVRTDATSEEDVLAPRWPRPRGRARSGSRSTPTAARPSADGSSAGTGAPGPRRIPADHRRLPDRRLQRDAPGRRRHRQAEPVDGDRGVIINTASVAAYEGQIGQLPYAAAKGGVVGMTLVAARDLSPLGIRVVTIAPGTFLTPAYGKAGDQLEAYWGPQVPHPKRMGRPPSTPPWSSTSARTTTSTARSSASTARSGSRRSDPERDDDGPVRERRSLTGRTVHPSPPQIQRWRTAEPVRRKSGTAWTREGPDRPVPLTSVP